MLNINYGHNDKLMGSCKRLHDYAYFVQRIKDGQAAGLNLETAIRVAMDECIERDILADLLIKSRSEVYHMLLTEFDEKAYKKRLYKDGVQDGIEQGMAVLIKVLQEQGKPRNEVEKILQKEYDLSAKDSYKYIEEYWKS